MRIKRRLIRMWRTRLRPRLTWWAAASSDAAATIVAALARRVDALARLVPPLVPARARPRAPGTTELRAALARCRAAFIGLAAASALVNLLMLVGPLFMLQVYDRVLPSRSVPTLIGLGMLALALFCAFGVVDALRARIVTRIARAWHEQIGDRIFDAVMRQALLSGSLAAGIQPLRDLETLRAFMAGASLTALFDLPWMPLYVGICFLFHPWMGIAVLIGAVLLCGVTFMTEMMSRAPTAHLVAAAGVRQGTAETALRNAVVVHALGMQARLRDRWAEEGEAVLAAQQRLADVTTGFGSLSRAFRTALQSGVLGLGAYLVIQQQATAGVMLAATILSVRALAPVELAIANWRGFLAARQSWRRLAELFAAYPGERGYTPLATPTASLRVTALSLLAPGGASAVLHGVSFTLAAGSVLGVVGPSGAGKSSLARALVGAWKPARGTIRLDGAALAQWEPDALGRHIGYLPQDVALFPGTVAQNIARFDPAADVDKMRKAAREAGVHDLILRLPQGYETQVGEGGALLSGGQRQRIALARALYGEPFLVVLDEPNANLDGEGEAALAAAVRRIRARKGIVVLIAHRAGVLAQTDSLLVLNEGHVQGLGATAAMLAQLSLRQAGAPAERPTVVRSEANALAG